MEEFGHFGDFGIGDEEGCVAFFEGEGSGGGEGEVHLFYSGELVGVCITAFRRGEMY